MEEATGPTTNTPKTGRGPRGPLPAARGLLGVLRKSRCPLNYQPLPTRVRLEGPGDFLRNLLMGELVAGLEEELARVLQEQEDISMEVLVLEATELLLPVEVGIRLKKLGLIMKIQLKSPAAEATRLKHSPSTAAVP